MRILVLGAGALGGYFGARLLAAGRDVTFLVREATRQTLATNGLHLRSAYGDLDFPHPPLVTSAAEPYDLILLTCKSWDLPAAIESIAPAVGPGSFVLPLLNGMAHLAALDEHFGPARVLGGLSNISAVRAPDGRIDHLNRLHTLQFGARVPGLDLAPLAEALHDANFDDQLRPDILQAMWDKWMTITTAAGATCLLRGTIADIVEAGAVPVVDAITAEASAVAAAEGYPTSAAMRRGNPRQILPRGLALHRLHAARSGVRRPRRTPANLRRAPEARRKARHLHPNPRYRKRSPEHLRSPSRPRNRKPDQGSHGKKHGLRTISCS